MQALLLALLLIAAEPQRGRCERVIDGDTLEIRLGTTLRTCRLAGIDAPETLQRFGPEATAELKRRTLGKGVTIVKEGEDQGGVWLVHASAGGSINRGMVQAGLARWYRQFPSGDKQLPQIEQEAKAAGRGLWADKESIAPWDWRRGKR